ncbi:MAG TPA: CaiB/BaiF CoA-transferase family protein [Myxococcota bacterium]|jgi:alpha-methylacyl-CoA racemase
MSAAPPAAALDGIRVLDFSTVGPAARCARILADYGAELVKVGSPRKAALQIEPAHWAYGAGRGVRRIRIDLKAREGREAFLRLVGQADVVLESFRPGVASRLGVGYADACRVNPRIIYCSTSGYGQTGPASGWAGHDLDYLAVGGFLHMSGRGEGGAPQLPGASIADAAAGGMQAAIAILAALLRRARTGRGEFLDVSVAEGVLSLMALLLDEHLATGADPAPGHDVLSGRFACYGVYATRDERWLAVGAIEAAFWANLCRALGLERWIAHQYDDSKQDLIRAELAAAFRTRDRDAWVAELAPADTCVAPVLSVSELPRFDQFRARGVIGEVEQPQHGRFRQLAPVLAGAARPDSVARVRGAEASDAEPLLRAAGYPAAEIEALLGAGTVA